MATETMNNEAIEGEIVLPPIDQAGEIFKPNGLDRFIQSIRQEVQLYAPDVTTERGRKQIASLARKVASAKVRMDDLGKHLVASIKQQALTIDVERKRMRDQMDALRDETRKPLTDWESAENERVESHESALAKIAELSNPPFGTPSEELGRMLDEIDAFSNRKWDEYLSKFIAAHREGTDKLARLFSETRKQEDERAELERLRAAEAERQQAEREARAKADAEAAVKAREEAAAAAAKAEADERVRKAEESAQMAVEREQRRVAEAARLEQEAATKREANKRHVGKIHDVAVKAMIASITNMNEAQAQQVVALIADGGIPNLRFTY